MINDGNVVHRNHMLRGGDGMDIIVNGVAGTIERAPQALETTRLVSALASLRSIDLPSRHALMPWQRRVSPALKQQAGTYRVQDWTKAGMGAGIAPVAAFGDFGGFEATVDTFRTRVGPPPPLRPPV
jgi:hypothetical protein